MADKKNIEDILGEPEEKVTDPLTATPGGEGNPLEKMDKISKEKPQKTDKDSKTLDEDVINELLKTGENTDGMFIPDEKKEDKDKLHEKEVEEAKLKVGKDIKPSKKYEKQFKNDMLKHPDQYKVNTPQGEMTVSEAIRKGYNPITKQFEKEHDQNSIKEKHLSQLNDADRAAIEKVTDPTIAQVAPADAEMYGLDANSPMVKSATPQPAMPVAPAMPTSTEGGGLDLNALLGGGQ